MNVNISGRYEITYSVADSAGATATETRVIIVTSQPTISGADTVRLNPGSAFDLMEGIVANDAEDGPLTADVQIISNNLNVDVPGTYTIIYYVKDSDGAELTVNRTVIVTEPPKIIGVGDININPDGTFDSMAGVRATDKEDDNSTLEVTITGGTGVGQD